jgi:Flp pilus assembly protein TadG
MKDALIICSVIRASFETSIQEGMMKILNNQRGQSLVEFSIILPLLLLIIMGIAEFGMMLNSYLTIRNASREGARAAIVGSSNVEIENIIVSTSPNLEAEDLIIDITPSEVNRKSGGMLTVRLTYKYQLMVPIISNLFGGELDLNAQTSMRIE